MREDLPGDDVMPDLVDVNTVVREPKRGIAATLAARYRFMGP